MAIPVNASDLAGQFNPAPQAVSEKNHSSSKDNLNLYLYASIGAAIIIIGAGIYYHVKLEEQHSRTLSLLDQIESQNHFLMKALKEINSSPNLYVVRSKWT